MGIKSYILFSIIFIVAVGAYVFSLNGDTYTLTLFGIPITLKVALWVAIPPAILMIATILHMLFYNFKDYLKQRNVNKDYKNFILELKNQLLSEPSNIKYVSDLFKLPSKLIKFFKFDPLKSTENFEEDEFKDIIEDLKKVENGEVVDLKKYKLSKDNYYVIKNSINEIEKDNAKAELFLKKCEDNSSEVCLKAFEVYLKLASSYEDIKKYDFEIDKEQFIILLDRFENKEDNFNFNVDELIELFKRFDFEKTEYLKYAKKIKVLLNPEATISIFEKISAEKSKALEAYLYLLFEFGMIDKAREVLDNIEKDECEKFRYFLYLKDNGKNFDIDIFFD